MAEENTLAGISAVVISTVITAVFAMIVFQVLLSVLRVAVLSKERVNTQPVFRILFATPEDVRFSF